MVISLLYKFRDSLINGSEVMTANQLANQITIENLPCKEFRVSFTAIILDEQFRSYPLDTVGQSGRCSLIR